MPLNDRQRRQLRTEVRSVIDDELQRALQEHLRPSARSRDYERDILSDRNRADSGDGFNLAHLVRSIALGGSDPERAAEIARQSHAPDAVIRTLQGGSAEAGGAFLRDGVAQDFINLLRPATAIRQTNPRFEDLDVSTVQIGKLTEGIQTEWVGETGPSPIKQVKTGRIALTPKFLSVTTPMSLALLRAKNSIARIDDVVRSDMVLDTAEKEDVAFLEGPGTEFRPKGLLNWAAATHKFDATQAGATPTVAEVTADIQAAQGKLANANVPNTSRYWVMREEVKLFLEDLRDSGSLVYPELRESTPMLKGSRVVMTNSIPGNLGVSEGETRIFYVASNLIRVGDGGLLIRTSDSASFTDVDAVTKNAFTSLSLLLQIVLITDLVADHPEAISVIEAVKWASS